VDRLRSLGYPVNSTSGVDGGYQLGAGANLPPLLLDDDEAVAVAVGLRTAASGTVTGIEEASVRALTKLEQVLPERLRRRVSALHSSILSLVRGGPSVDADLLATLAGACRDLVRLRFPYSSRDGTGTAREVEPHRLVHTGRRWYLVAWDLNREQWRTFRVDRIQPRISAGARFTPRPAPEGDFAAYVVKSVSFDPYPHQAVARIAASAEHVAERIPPGVAILEAVDDSHCTLHTGAGSLDMLALHLAMIGYDFEVLQPPELIERLRRLAERFGRAAHPAR
jgi:predicted DNA-binding transcriptional regulator YafY